MLPTRTPFDFLSITVFSEHLFPLCFFIFFSLLYFILLEDVFSEVEGSLVEAICDVVWASAARNSIRIEIKYVVQLVDGFRECELWEQDASYPLS